MFPILLGRLERLCRNDDDKRTWHADRRELIDMLKSKPVLRNDGELDAIARILHVRGGEEEKEREAA